MKLMILMMKFLFKKNKLKLITKIYREMSEALITALDYINIEDYIIYILKERLNMKKVIQK